MVWYMCCQLRSQHGEQEAGPLAAESGGSGETLGALLARLGLQKAAAQLAENDIETVDDLRLLTEEESKAYWADRLGRSRLRARQISARGGELGCEHAGERVLLTGRAVTYLRGEIELP